jgi:ribose 5-phosphate isomerase B
MFAHRLAALLAAGSVDIGLALCGTGHGMAITLNRHTHVRAGIAWNADIAALIRQHNNANVCVIPARFTNAADIVNIADSFIGSRFEGGRHQSRVDMINII